jgi:hypothetical protein
VCRKDIVSEVETTPLVFVQEVGPFSEYRRVVTPDPNGWRETITYRLQIPWFAWVFGFLVARHLRRLRPDQHPLARTPWWAPPDRLNASQVSLLGLLAAASMSAAYINTVFSQTVKFAADDLGVGSGGIGVAGSVVRAGIIISLPAAFLADRIGRRRVVLALAWAAPVATALGALMPTFALLVASQTIGRPLGIALGFLIAVIAAEEMPRGTRAYAVSVLAMASGLGAGIAVMALPLADLGPALGSGQSWPIARIDGVQAGYPTQPCQGASVRASGAACCGAGAQDGVWLPSESCWQVHCRRVGCLEKARMSLQSN